MSLEPRPASFEERLAAHDVLGNAMTVEVAAQGVVLGRLVQALCRQNPGLWDVLAQPEAFERTDPAEVALGAAINHRVLAIVEAQRAAAGANP